MVIKYKNQRVVVLIDVQNLYHSAKNLYGARVNFKNLLIEAISGRNLIRAIGYVVKSDEPGEASFFDALEKAGIETKIKDLQIYADGVKKGDWDVGLTIDAVKLSSKTDVIVLVSGDGDFIPLVEYLKALGNQVEVMGFGRTTSTTLKETADEFIDLETRSEYFLLKINEGSSASKISKFIKFKI